MGGIGQLGTLTPNVASFRLTTQATLTSTVVVVDATVGKQLWENLLTLKNTTIVVRSVMGYYGLLQKQGFGVDATAVDVAKISDTTFVEFVTHFASTATVANSANGANDDVSTLVKCLSFAIVSVVIVIDIKKKVWALASYVALSRQRVYPTQPVVSIFKGQVS